METSCVECFANSIPWFKFDMDNEFEFAKEHFGLESFKYKDLAKLRSYVYTKYFNAYVRQYNDLCESLTQTLPKEKIQIFSQLVRTLSDKVVFYMIMSWILNNKLTPKD
ncbi:MAG: hypothetical protein HUU45_09205 [Leptospiraceae bacterium]|nr:hypothetical protein [Leptospiraceae bacterium]